MEGFFGREAGQRRRKWLEGLLGEYVADPVNYLLGPTGIPSKTNTAMGLLEFTDAGDVSAATEASANLWNDPTFANALDYATAGAAMALPMVSARMMREGVDVAGNAADELRRFARSESGAIGPGSESKAQEVARLLREGRGDEVTDDMLAEFDANDEMELFKLYESGATGVDMPMDTASRMTRAEGMGSDPLSDFYHGTAKEGFVDTTDIRGFDPERTGDRWNADERGFSMTSSPQDANYYSRRSDSSKGNLGDGMVYPLVDMSKNPMRMRPKDSYSGTIGTWDERPDNTYEILDAGGHDAVDIYADGVNMRVSMDPTNIRSRFARFDPRLKHLRNLSAGIAGVGILNAQDEEELKEYLGLL